MQRIPFNTFGQMNSLCEQAHGLQTILCAENGFKSGRMFNGNSTTLLFIAESSA